MSSFHCLYLKNRITSQDMTRMWDGVVQLDTVLYNWTNSVGGRNVTPAMKRMIFSPSVTTILAVLTQCTHTSHAIIIHSYNLHWYLLDLNFFYSTSKHRMAPSHLTKTWSNSYLRFKHLAHLKGAHLKCRSYGELLLKIMPLVHFW